ncbi:hypothetical protein Aperf_G00000107158 [Anoplocephala perfoliata]
MQASEIFVDSNGFQSPGTQSMSGDYEIGIDSAASTIFSSDYQKNDEVIKMLDSNKDNLKLMAMRRIITMVARGKNCSVFFSAVVKNVVSKDPEIKKLVYAYLVRYAEEQQDLALLSISTFQRSLKDSNQLIRASALRVLSSIRIPVIAPILMLAVRDGAVDLSPYVRKTVAHAIPKLYSLEPEEKDSLVEIIKKLLEDKSTVVAGSAVQAFEEVCPERLDLIHKHYRKLCSLLMDVDEWGQIAIINLLTRYARTQFPDPKTCVSGSTPASSKNPPPDIDSHQNASSENKQKANGDNNSKDEDEAQGTEDSDEDGENSSKEKHLGEGVSSPEHAEMLRNDFRLLITGCRLLLLSHNAAVVLAVAQLFYHCAPKEEMPAVIRALMRILRSTKEIEYVVLSNVASLSLLHPALFEPYIRMFFVFKADSTQVKMLKLEILTNLVNTSTSSLILREFQAYVDSSDSEFVLATVQSIGRCASMVPQIAETCLRGLLRLMSRKNESLVAESVVVMRKLLQMQTTDHKDIIMHLAQLVEEITTPSARASILWLLGEYGHRVPKIAPDVLRKMAKTFPKEHKAVKLQVLNLAAKLCIVNPKQTLLIAQYVFTLAKYDQNYDIRDRSRMFRALIFPKNADSMNQEGFYLARNVKKILLATKPAPVLRSTFADRPTFRLGSMSQLLGRKAANYMELPDWPEVPPDPTTRQVAVAPPVSQPPLHTGSSSNNSGRSLSISQQETETEEDTEEDTEDDEDVESEDEEEEVGESSEGDDDEEEEEDEVEVDGKDDEETDVKTSKKNGISTETESDSDAHPSRTEVHAATPSTESSLETEEDDDDGSEEEVKRPTISLKEKKIEEEPVDLLFLDLDAPAIPTVDSGGALSSLADPLIPIVVTPSVQKLDSPVPDTAAPSGESKIELTIPTYEIASPEWFYITSAYATPLLVEGRFTRAVSASKTNSPTAVELRMTNRSIAPALRILHIHPDRTSVEKSSKGAGKFVHCVESFNEIASLDVGSSVNVFIDVDFCDSTQPLRLNLRYQVESLEGGQVAEAQEDEESKKPQEVLTLEIKPTVGELFQPLDISPREFVAKQASLRGMHEMAKSFTISSSIDPNFLQVSAKQLLKRANLALIGAFAKNDKTECTLLRLAGVTASDNIDCLVEVTFVQEANEGTLRVNTEAVALGIQLAEALLAGLAGSK